MSDKMVIWVSGASSGIGAAFVDAVPDESARVIGISRRERPNVEQLTADLGDPTSWAEVGEHFDQVLGDGQFEQALFFHCAGTIEGIGPLVATESAAYTHGVMVNAAAGQVLGRAFVVAAARADVRATLVMCSSPAAKTGLSGLSHYCAGKAALEHWVRSVAAEVGDEPGAPRVFSVSPRGVDTAMMRETMERSPAEIPLAGVFRKAASEAAMVTPSQTATQIWQAITAGVPQGAVLPVGITDQIPESES